MTISSIAEVISQLDAYDFFHIGIASTSKPYEICDIIAYVQEGELVTLRGTVVSPGEILYWVGVRLYSDKTYARFVNGSQAFTRTSILALPSSRRRRRLLQALNGANTVHIVTWRSHPELMLTTDMPMIVVS